MSEDEARTRWCPFSRVVKMQGDHPTDAEAYGQTRCIASNCMAWRWEAVGVLSPNNASGYCGLAGKP